MTLTITFRPPPRSDLSSESVTHERQFYRVPASVAEAMIRDFSTYRAEGEGMEQRKIYRFLTNGKETVLALDFEEVISIKLEES